MSFLRDKQIRYFLLGVAALLCFQSILNFSLCTIQKNAVQDIFIQHDAAIVSALLEQGISQEIIAQAITTTDSSPAGYTILEKLGMGKQADTRLLPFIQDFQHLSTRFTGIKDIVCSILLLAIILLFLWQREQLYQGATKTVKAYTNGDFSTYLPQSCNGMVYHLFAQINTMASALKSKQEAEYGTKEFLKSTISDISHQLKTPLAALTMYNEIILNEPENASTVSAFAQKARTALERMEGLIQALLKITRLDAGGISFDMADYPIMEVLSRSVQELTVRAVKEEKEILISGNRQDKLLCDIEWTGEAVGNIVKNALDHTAKGGKIQVKAVQTPAAMRILIQDNGTGIAPEDFHHIFKRFYRSRNSKDTQGVGLGLPLAKAIIEEQGGTVSVESKKNEGTTFTLSFLTKL